MPLYNFTLNGDDFFLRSANSPNVQNINVLFVQWELGYDPKYRPMSEWTGNPIKFNWTGSYTISDISTGGPKFSSSLTTTEFDSPIYMYMSLGSASNYDQATMSGQAWMGQITDVLTQSDTPFVINLNDANIRPVVGSIVGNTLVSQDWNTWQPTAVPEPSYTGLAGLLFVGVVIYKKYA